MLVNVSTLLACAPERAWQEVQTPRLLNHITSPLVRFEPLRPRAFPATWEPGRYRVRMWLFGLIPFGQQWIVISKTATAEGYEMLDDGHGDFIERWRHRITLRPAPDGRTRYTDTVEIEAGLLTAGVWLYAHVFYRYRQTRWRQLVKNNFKYL